MEGLLKTVISDKKSNSGDFFILVLLSPAIISGSVISFVLRISTNYMGARLYLFVRFTRDKRIWLCFPQIGHPQIN